CRARPPRAWPARRPVPSQRAGPDPASAPLLVRETQPPRRRPLGTGHGPLTVPGRRLPPHPDPWPPGPDATLDDRDRRPDLFPGPGRFVPAVDHAVGPPGKRRRARGDDGNAPAV